MVVFYQKNPRTVRVRAPRILTKGDKNGIKYMGVGGKKEGR
jgi:hypothetical protein